MAATATGLDLKSLIRSGIGVPLGVLAALAMVVLPLPPLALDVLFTFNIALSLIVVMAVFYVSRPLDFGVFPTVLLLATLLRLALNVASTRVVLLHGVVTRIGNVQTVAVSRDQLGPEEAQDQQRGEAANEWV